MDFVGGNAWVNGVATPITSLISCTRASANGYYTNTNGVLVPFAANTLRMGNNGLLVEEQRANILNYSGDLTNGGVWGTGNCTCTTAAGVFAPDNVSHPALITTSSTGFTQLFQGATVTSAPWSWSIFLKAGTSPFAYVSAWDTATRLTYINLATGAVTSNPGANTVLVTPLSNSWFRVCLSRTAAAGSGYLSIGPSDNGTTQTGTVGNTFYAWGGDVEAGAFPTSYIPTTSAAVTRNADAVSGPTSGFTYNSAEGTLFASWAESSGVAGTSYDVAKITTSGAFTEALVLYVAANAATGISRHLGTPIGVSPTGSVLAYPNVNKGILAVNNASMSGCLNNNNVASVTGTTVPSPVGTIYLGGLNGYVGSNGAIYLKRVTYWGQKLSDVNIKALTA
jgi:hypothetical protein